MNKEPKWKVGDIARYPNRSCPRMYILEATCNAESDFRWWYLCLSSSGSVCCNSEQNLLTLDEWLAFWERMRDDITPREWRERAEAAKAEFVPPAWWNEAVTRATAKP